MAARGAAAPGRFADGAAAGVGAEELLPEPDLQPATTKDNNRIVRFTGFSPRLCGPQW